MSELQFDTTKGVFETDSQVVLSCKKTNSAFQSFYG